MQPSTIKETGFAEAVNKSGMLTFPLAWRLFA
jgi:hypothetical protein